MTEKKPVRKNDLPEGEHEMENGAPQVPGMSDADLLASRIAELEGSVSQYKDQLLRKAAEFDNYKKRVDNDYASIVRFSNEDLILKLLPVLDDFERSFKMAGRGGDQPGAATGGGEDSFRRGMELIYNKFRKILEAQGIKPIEALGKPFDPHLHEALLQMPRNDVPPHTVIEEVDKGYMLNDKVLRHSKVVVAADSSPGEETPGGAGGPEREETR
ncbi:MAG TPA: nucleotide exchange factor GrpE [Bacteroidota bacterium]|jgi:molecular chaperone GrpE